MQVFRRKLHAVCALAMPAMLFVLGASPTSWAASAPTFSLSSNWSNTTNPNQPWTYRQGTTALPLIADYTFAGTGYSGCDQPAWAPSNSSGKFLPSLVKANSCAAAFLGTDPNNGNKANALPGDIIVHTVDGANGNSSLGVANFLFTLPHGDDGTYVISGSVWDAKLDQPSRPQDWQLLVNGVKKASGSLSGSVSRSQAQHFSVTVGLAAGDTVELDLIRDAKSTYGYLVGTSMTIAPTCALTDTAKYASGTLTMNYTVGTPVAATWNGWLISGNNATSLFTKAVTDTGLPQAETITHTLSPSGKVGVLSTLSTATAGITCSSFVLVSTGTP